MAVIMENGERLYEGCVLCLREHNGREDSDFYAQCIDVKRGMVVDVEYATTRFAGGGRAEVDITAENYRLYLHKSRRFVLGELIADDRKKAAKVEKGKEVVAVRGRKVPIGTKGTIFYWREENYDKYGRFSGNAVKIGLKDENDNVYWTYAKNVEVVSPNKYYTPVQDIKKHLKQQRGNSYVRMFGKEAKR